MAYVDNESSSYDATPSGPQMTAADVIALRDNPSLLQDPRYLAAKNPEEQQQILMTLLKQNDPNYDPKGDYIIGPSGVIQPNDSSWFSDNLPWITAAMGAALGGAGIIGGLEGGASAGTGAAATVGGDVPATTGLSPEVAASLGETVPISGGIVPASSIAGGAAADSGLVGLFGPDEEAGMLPSTITTPLTGDLPAGVASGTDAAAAGADLTGASDVLPSTPIGTGDMPPIGGPDVLPSTPIGTGDMPPITGVPSGTDAAAAGVDLGSAGGTLGTIGKYAKLLSQVGRGISSATNAADNRRLATADKYVSRGRLEDEQRNQALKNLYVADRANNPSHSIFDPVPAYRPSGNYAAALNDISNQGLSTLSKPATYNAANFPSLEPGTLEQIGQWAGPLLSIIGNVGQFV